MIEKIKLKKTSDTVFIIGGGSSLAKTLPNPSLISNRDIICTNDAYILFPNAMVLLFADKSWFSKRMLDVQNNFKGIVVACPNNVADERYYINNKIDNIFNRGLDNSISETPDKLCGTNSGHIAINLAVLMGYKKIVLIGFDMDDKVRKTHWHDKHLEGTVTSRYKEVFLPAFETVVPFQDQLGFKIYNLNRESCLKSFEFADLQDFL